MKGLVLVTNFTLAFLASDVGSNLKKLMQVVVWKEKIGPLKINSDWSDESFLTNKKWMKNSFYFRHATLQLVSGKRRLKKYREAFSICI